MKKYYLMGLLLCSCYTLIGSSYLLATKKEVVPIEITKRLILVKAKVNQQKGYFVFDTGVFDLMLNERYFGHYHQLDFERALTDVSGAATSIMYVPVKTFHWGKLSRRNFSAPNVNLSGLEQMLGKKLLGLIGYNVIKSLEVIIDYHGETITLLDLDKNGLPAVAPPLPADYRFDFSLMDFIPVLDVAFDNNISLKLGLDSGSTLNLIDKSLEPQFQTISRSNRMISFKGVLSEVRQVNYLLMENVAIQKQVGWRFWKAAFEDISHMRQLNVPVDGLLGINFFRIGKVSINYRKKEIKVWEKENGYQDMIYGLK